MTAYVSFHRNIRVHPNGMTRDEMLALADAELESSHDIIQWAFPKRTPGMPMMFLGLSSLTFDQIDKFRNDEYLQQSIKKCFNRYLNLYGLEEKENGDIGLVFDFKEKAENWITPHNHNFRRITRIIECLGLCDMQDEVNAFFECLTKEIYSQKKYQEIIDLSDAYIWWEKFTHINEEYVKMRNEDNTIGQSGPSYE